jgi:hypothetical protein
MRRRTSAWYYIFVLLIPVLGCLISLTIAYLWCPDVVETFESKINMDNLTQVVVPGSADIVFTDKGAYAVYYEYRSIVDGVTYRSSETPPALTCTLTSNSTGAEVETTPDYVKTNTYSTQRRERVGVLIQSITIKEPGTYTFSCSYADDNSHPEIVLAVGPNHVWEFFRIAAKCGVPFFIGLLVIFGSILIAIITAIAVTVKRG